MASPVEVADTFCRIDMQQLCKILGMKIPNPMEGIPEVYEDHADNNVLQQTGTTEVVSADNTEAERA
jgi:hypothetical protein